MKALKFLRPGAIGPYSGFKWPVPNGKPGKWVTTKGDLIECRRGIHACTLDQAGEWLQSECYVIELSGKIVIGEDKLVARKGRLLYKTPLTDSSLRLFAADCAEHVLHLFEAERPNDDCLRKTIETARAFAKGRATRTELAAARAAAQAAAQDAARDAARDAAWAAERAAARAAAQDAARDAAWAAAWSAAGAAERAAARAAERAAARAAAQGAARDAERDAAWSAERRWQTRRLRRYLNLRKGWYT